MKKVFRQIVAGNKKQFKESKDYKYVLEAAVYKGAYQAIGGVKAFSIPAYAEDVSNTTEALIKFIQKRTGNLEQDIKKLNNCVKKNVHQLIDITLEKRGERTVIVIKGRDTYEIAIDKLISEDDILILIGLAIIRNSRDYAFSSVELEVIQDSMRNVIRMLEAE